MLNIQEENNVVLNEFVCSDCETWFLIKCNEGEIVCPHCGLIAYNNGEFRIKNIEVE